MWWMRTMPTFGYGTILRTCMERVCKKEKRCEKSGGDRRGACRYASGRSGCGTRTYEMCIRDRRKALPNTKLQMLFRGQNILGYKHYADDVVEQFCRKAIENGIDVIRIFDALNDVRNLEAAIRYTKKYGGICEPEMCIRDSDCTCPHSEY